MKMRALRNVVVVALALSTPMIAVNAQTITHISGISPSSATYGATITITGTGFDPQKNDIGFVKVKSSSDHIGYVNNVPSKDGKTLVFQLPQYVGVCPLYFTGGPGVPCIEIALLLDEGEYEIFVLNKAGKSNIMMFTITSSTGEPLTKIIPTSKGELTLSFDDGTATLSGVLQRSTPCVDWRVNVMMTKDKPPSQVEFQIYDANKDDICIQVLGKPQAVNATATAGENTFYKVMLEDDVVFSGKLTGSGKEEKGNVYVKSIGETGKLLASWNYEESKGIIVLLNEESRMLVRFTFSSSTCTHDSEECIEGLVISSNSEIYSKESKIRLEIGKTGTLYLALLDNATPQNEHSFNMKKMKSTVTVEAGQKEGPLLVEEVFADHIVGLNFPEFPIAVAEGLPVTLRVGDTVSNGCTVRLKLLDIHDDSATFLKTIEQKEICPICWHNK